MAKIHLNNVRLSFPSLFKRSVFDGKEGKFEATFLIDKNDVKLKKQLDTAIAEALKASKVAKVSSDKRCLKDGDESEYDGCEGVWTLKASNNKRPTVIGKDKSPLAEEDEVLYAGCYVNAIVDFWIQNNSYGKRVNCNLLGVQYLKDGEPFGQGPVDVADDFEAIDDGLGDGDDDL